MGHAKRFYHRFPRRLRRSQFSRSQQCAGGCEPIVPLGRQTKETRNLCGSL